MPIGEVTGLVPDPFGALYFISRNSVFKLDLDGTVNLVAGTGDRPGTQGNEGAATLAHLSYPATLALGLFRKSVYRGSGRSAQSLQRRNHK